MSATRTNLGTGTALGLVVGLGLGVLLASGGPAPLRAAGGDRSGESILATGPIAVRYDEANKIQMPEDALYYLDYRSGRLKATIPSYRQTPAGTRHLDAFAERDLVTDFQIDLDNGAKPHFLMTTGQLGTLGAGWAPLFVVETTTGKVGVYKVQQMLGPKNQIQIDLLQMRSTDSTEEPVAASPRGRVVR